MWRKARVRRSDTIAAKAELCCLLHGIITPPPVFLGGGWGSNDASPLFFNGGMLEKGPKGRRPPPAPGRNNGHARLGR